MFVCVGSARVQTFRNEVAVPYQNTPLMVPSDRSLDNASLLTQSRSLRVALLRRCSVPYINLGTEYK